MGHPYKSTTHEELFFHVQLDYHPERPGATTKHRCSWKTVFARRADDGQWYASVAYCDARDQFSREAGRKVARRKWFQAKRARMAWIDHTKGPDFNTAVNFNLNHV